MLASVKGMLITLASTLNGFRAPVTRQYPTTPTPVKPRYMGFPALTWDDKVDEPFCTACMVCIRNCPTQCMSATMKDNPLQQEGKSHRRKIVDTFRNQPQPLHPVRHLRQRLQFRRHCHEPRARVEYVRTQRRPHGPS